MLTHCGTQMMVSGKLILRQFQYTDDDDMLAHWIIVLTGLIFTRCKSVIKMAIWHHKELSGNVTLLTKELCGIFSIWMVNM